MNTESLTLTCTESLTLTYGNHPNREQGMCLMEAVAFLGGEEHSDHPECSCPVIAAFGRALNDRMGMGEQGDALRAKYLAPLARNLVGTRSTPEVERRRAYFLADRAVRLFAPLALESAGLGEEAERLRSLPEIVDEETAGPAADAADAAADAAVAAADAAAAVAASVAASAASAAAADAAADAAAYAADAAVAAADADACAAAVAAADAAAYAAEAWEKAAKVLAEACEITEGGE